MVERYTSSSDPEERKKQWIEEQERDTRLVKYFLVTFGLFILTLTAAILTQMQW